MGNQAPQIIKLSASAIKTYEQCPRKYYFNYIEKAPKKQWEHFDLGNLCHKTLELFHLEYMDSGTSKKTLSKLMSSSFAEARKSFPNIRDEMALDAKDMLAKYLEYVKKHGMPVVKGCETPFDFSLGDNILVRGFIDRVDILKDGRFRIIDYKTTKSVKYLDEFQLSVYGIWLQNQHPNVDAFNGAYVLLRHGSSLKEYSFNAEDIEKTKKYLVECAGKLRTENTWTAIPTMLCNWCDFKEICPAQQAW
jgi:RecB family exonuclease